METTASTCFKCGRSVYPTVETAKEFGRLGIPHACPQCSRLLNKAWDEAKETRHIREPSPSARLVLQD